MDNKENSIPLTSIKIEILENGPYMVHGCPEIYQEFIIPDEYGASVEYKRGKRYDTDDPVCICRCGQSLNKPYCDGSHKEADWDSTETAPHDTYDNMSKEYEGPQLTMMDEEDLCAVARFCHVQQTNVWKLALRGKSDEEKEITIKKTLMCPSGRLSLEDAETGENPEKKAPMSLALLEDPANNVSGPIWVQGGISIIGADGYHYERRNRVTLCRCGKSTNKPFCDATHLSEGWMDDLY